MNAAAMQQTLKHWEYINPYAHIPCNEAEYERLLAFYEELRGWTQHNKNAEATNLLRLVAGNIEAYESHRYPSKKVTPVEMLKFIMEENNLEQGDLPEIGSQSLVSKILSGERQLTLEHIRGLSKRFGISPAVFC